MAVVSLGFYEPDGTTLIGTLTDEHLIECEARPALMELGALRIVVSRHLAEASAALLAKGNIVKVTYPLIDPDPIAPFVLKDDTSQLIDSDEEGGEHLEVTGPGALWILQHSRLREEVYAPGQPARGDWDDDLSWNWRNRFYGSILVRVIEEGQNQPGSPLSAISIDFDRDVDSDGVPWALIAEDFSVPIGTDLLTVADRLAAAGDLYLVLTSDMVLHAYQTYGRDLTGAFAADNVRFEKDVNLLTELQRKTKIDRVTHLITRDMDGVFRTYATPETFDQAVYGFLEVGWTNDPDQVEKTALHTIATSGNAAELYTVESLPGLAPEQGEYLPGPEGTDGHFWPGDEVTLHTGSAAHDLNEATAKVTAVSIVLDIAADDETEAKAARSLHIVPELVIGTPAPAFSGVGDGAAKGGVGCQCIRLCQPLQGTAAGTPVGVYLSNHVSTSVIVPDGTVDAMIFLFILQESDQGFGSVTYAGSAMTAVPGSEHTHSSLIPGRADASKSKWYSALVADNTSGVPRSDGVSFGGSYYGYAIVPRVSAVGAVAVSEGTGTAASASVAAGSGGVVLAGLAGWQDQSGAGSSDPTIAAPATMLWAENGMTGLGPMHFAIAYGDATPAFTLGASTPWIVSALWVQGIGSGGDEGPMPVGANDEADHGSSVRATRCDHVHPHSDLSDHDDEIHHAIASIDGLQAALDARVEEADADWVDLTDGGATTLHSHAGGSGPDLSDDTPLVESGSGSPGTSPDASRSDHVHPADGGGGGGSSRWSQVINESGASFANFTASSGTWASDGTIITQSNTTATQRRAQYNTKLPQGTGVIYEAEVRIPSAGQSVGADRRAGLLIGYVGAGGAGAMGIWLRDDSDTLYTESDATVALRSFSVTIAQDTWYKVRAVVHGSWASIWFDGTFLGEQHFSPYNQAGDYLGLYTYNVKADFRNIKAWTATADLPA